MPRPGQEAEHARRRGRVLRAWGLASVLTLDGYSSARRTTAARAAGPARAEPLILEDNYRTTSAGQITHPSD